MTLESATDWSAVSDAGLDEAAAVVDALAAS